MFEKNPRHRCNEIRGYSMGLLSQWDVNSVIKNCLCYDALCFFLRDFCLNH